MHNYPACKELISRPMIITAVPEEPSNVGAIVGAVLGVLVVIVLVIVVFFFVRRRMAKKSTMYRQSEPQHLSMKRTKTTR